MAVRRGVGTIAVTALAGLAAGCAGGRGAGPEATRAVEIVAPAAGSAVSGPDVTVVLAARGFRVVPAGDTTSNSGHHHLFLDRDLSPRGSPIPAEPGRIVHLGNGSDRYTFTGLAPGSYRLIALVGDASHVPVEPLLSDTVRFSVR